MPLYTYPNQPVTPVLNVSSTTQTTQKSSAGRLTQCPIYIPHFSRKTVEQLLVINKSLIKILVEYQNIGWLNEPEYIMQVDGIYSNSRYQKRLSTNLKYLAAVADFMLQNKVNSPTEDIAAPCLDPVKLPDKLQDYYKSRGMKHAEANTDPTVSCTLSSMKLPTLVNDVHPSYTLVKESGVYVPAPPFTLPQAMIDKQAYKSKFLPSSLDRGVYISGKSDSHSSQYTLGQHVVIPPKDASDYEWTEQDRIRQVVQKKLGIKGDNVVGEFVDQTASQDTQKEKSIPDTSDHVFSEHVHMDDDEEEEEEEEAILSDDDDESDGDYVPQTHVVGVTNTSEPMNENKPDEILDVFTDFDW